MLQFIFGRPASGKTYTVLQKIKALAQVGRESVLIVPEQFSFESERAVLKVLGDKAAQRVTVVSFSRLCDEVGRQVGGMAAIPLSDADKVIFMKRALTTVRGELVLWQRYCKSVSFAKTMLDTVGEFKINAVSPAVIKKAAETAEGGLKAKLCDLALIYETYNALLGERFIDPADNLTRLYRQLENCRFFAGKTVFMDSFKGFTGQQYQIIDRIMAQAEDVFISLTNDPARNREYNLFSNIRASAEKIRRSAARYGVTEDKPLVLSEAPRASAGLTAVERLIAGENVTAEEKNEDIVICRASSAYDEAAFAASEIRRLVRVEGYRYRDFVIIARETEGYEELVLAACARNGIPCFTDRRIPLSAFPLSAAVNAAAENAVSPSGESILRFHKTGLGTLTTEEITVLENYTFLWNIPGKLWETEWDMDPRGFVSDDEDKKPDPAVLENINRLREKAIAPLLRFNAAFHGTAADMARAAVELAETCGAAEKLALLAERLGADGNEFSSDALKQGYDKYMRLLDSLATCFGEREIDRQEFCETLKLAVTLDSVGVIPRMLDEVTFGAADRIRPSRPKAAFILGANQGVFPKAPGGAGIFRISERRDLIEMGIDISDNALSAAIDEDFLVYCNLCCPSDRLFISYSAGSLTGEPMERSAFVATIEKALDPDTIRVPSDSLTAENLPETVDSAYSEYCRRRNSQTCGAAELKAALRDTAAAQKIHSLEERAAVGTEKIAPETAKALFGGQISMSATRFDTFHKCRFWFFCKYGLSTKKLQPAEFDVLQRGTLVHFVLERIVTEHGETLPGMSAAESDRLVEAYTDAYLDGIAGYRSVESPRSRFLVSRITRSLKEVVGRLAREFAQSDFKPVACELKIGKATDTPLIFPFDGGALSLSGSIDRVDEYNGYIRVIDYKTGSRQFKLPDILFGLNLQMLIYLYAIVRGRGIADEKAAGILYMQSKRDLDGSGSSMNGLLTDEQEIVAAMDKQLAGEFVPKYTLTKAGTLHKRCTSFVKNENFSEIFDYIERLMKKTGNAIVSGDIAVSPVDGTSSAACKYCDYKAVCRRENEPCTQVQRLSNSEVFEKIREEQENGV